LHLNLEYKGYKFNPQKSKFKVFNAKFYPYDPHTKALSLQNLKFLSVKFIHISLLQDSLPIFNLNLKFTAVLSL